MNKNKYLFLIFYFIKILSKKFKLQKKMTLLNNNFFILVLSKIILFCFWFGVGIYLYNKLTNSNYKIQINNFSFFELFLIFYTIFIFIMFIKTIFVDYILSLYISDIQFNLLFMVDGNNTESVNTINTEAVNTTSTNTESVNTSNSKSDSGESNSKYDGIIMSTALASGMTIASKVPSIAGKAGLMSGSAILGAGAIGLKNIFGNITADIGKKSNNIIQNITDLNKVIEEMFNLTGNNGLDLLNMIQLFQKLQLIFIIIIIYNFFLLNINEEKLENFLLNIFPTKIIKFYIKSLKIFKKSGFIIIICLLILLLISNLYSYSYLNFFIYHLDDIIEIYFKK